MNHAFDTPLYELLRMVNIQLKTRESIDGYKQGMKFDVSMQMLNTWNNVHFIPPRLFRITAMKVNYTSTPELTLPQKTYHKIINYS